MFKKHQDKAQEPIIQYDGTNFLEFSNSLKKKLAGNSDWAIVVPTLKTLKAFNPNQEKQRFQSILNTYETMMAMSSYPGAANDEEWITLAKEQMAAEGADPNANMLGISHVHDEADLGINFDIPTKTIPRDDDSSIDSDYEKNVRQPRFMSQKASDTFSRPKESDNWSRLSKPSRRVPQPPAPPTKHMSNDKFIGTVLQPWLRVKLSMTHGELVAATKLAAIELEAYKKASREIVIKLTRTSDSSPWVSSSILRKLEDGPTGEAYNHAKETHDLLAVYLLLQDIQFGSQTHNYASMI